MYAKSTIKKYGSKLNRKLYPFYCWLRLKKNGVTLVGYFNNVVGVAEVGRFFALNLKEAHIPFAIQSIELDSHQKLDHVEAAKYKPFIVPRPFFYTNIFFINADALPDTLKVCWPLVSGRYNIGVFWWEFDDYFHFPNAFSHLREVVVFSDFIATAVRKTAPAHIRVTKLPFPFRINWHITVQADEFRLRLGLSPTDYVFFFNFDFLSVLDRKNPQALLTAFQLAFPADTNAKLVLKTIHAEAVPVKYQEFMDAVEHLGIQERVIVIHDNLSRNEMISLINAADAYVSLHRSEGLGIGMLEAMALGKPVIGTRFGGNLEFMTDDTSLLVDYKLVPLSEDALPYKKGWLWADPDVQQAAAYMRRLQENPQWGMQLGMRAKNHIENRFSNASFKEALMLWSRKTPLKLPS